MPDELGEKVKRFRESQFKILQDKNVQPSDYELEMICYRNLPWGATMRHRFLIGLMEMQWKDDPLIFKIRDGDVENYWAIRQIKAFCHHRFITLMGCASSGKTHVIDAAAYTDWKAHAWETSILISTTSSEAADQRAWGSMKDFHRADRFKVGNLIDYKKSIVLESQKQRGKKAIEDRDYKNSIHLVMIKPGAEGDNALAAISGRKNDRVLWIKDEAQLMVHDTSQAEINLLSNPFCQIIQLGNAPKEGTTFYEDCKPFGPGFELGYKSVDLNTHYAWRTKKGVCFWFDGEKSPNVLAGKRLFKGLADLESIALMEKVSGGRDTPGYWTQARGFPHSHEVQDTVLNEALIEKHSATQPVIWRGDPTTPLGGLDLGFRKDGDPCVAYFGEIGIEAESEKLILLSEKNGVKVTPSSDSKLPFEEQIALKFIAMCEERKVKHVEIDITGDGGIILADVLKHAKGRISVVPKSFGGKPDDKPVGNGDDRLCSAVYDKMVTQLWYNIRFAVQAGVIRGMSLQSDCVKQLCSRKVIQLGQKVSVEPKKEMKKRIKRSPDDADAYCLLIDLARRHGLSTSVVPEKKAEIEDDEYFEQEERKNPYAESGHTKSQYAGRSYSNYH